MTGAAQTTTSQTCECPYETTDARFRCELPPGHEGAHFDSGAKVVNERGAVSGQHCGIWGPTIGAVIDMDLPAGDGAIPDGPKAEIPAEVLQAIASLVKRDGGLPTGN